MLYISGKTTSAIDCLKAAYRKDGKPPPDLSEALCNFAVQISLWNLFETSDPANDSNKSKGEPLGLLAEQIVMKLTGSEDETIVAWSCDNISNVPLLNVYGQISEMYIKLKRESSNLISSGNY